MAANGLVDDPSRCGCEAAGTAINTAGGTTVSSYSDLVLPVGSTIVKAYLYVEGYAPSKITSLKFKVPGSGYTTLTTASPGFIGNPTANGLLGIAYVQFIADVTNLVPSAGYISTVTTGGNAGTAGRYAVADLNAYSTGNDGYGWSLFVVYSNPISKYRNITIADACNTSTATVNITNISVPSSGPVNAVVVITGSYGDDGLTDFATFGKTGTTLTGLLDPVTGAANDMLNSTIGFCPQNNVSADGGPAMSGSFTGRNPYIFAEPNGAANWSSYYYDSDIINASGILPNSAVPINVTLTQKSGGGDAIGFGAFAISVDIASAVVTKSLAPSSIVNGGTATYTWIIDNTVIGALNLAGIGFTDNLPPNIIVANPTGATISGGSGGVVTAVPGGTSVKLTGLTLNLGQTATMSVNVTNVPGQLNASCATNPLAFTNGFANIVGNTSNVANGVTNQCLLVTLTVPIELLGFTAEVAKSRVLLNWSTASEENNSYFDVERSADGIAYTKVATIQAAGNSSVLQKYSLEDAHPASGLNYYRLKQVDFDGAVHYLKTVSLEIRNIFDNLAVNPQPVRGNKARVNFTAGSEGNITAAVYDISGRLVLQIPRETVSKGVNSIEVDISTLERGIYYLNISNSDGSLGNSIKLVKE